MNNKSLTVKEAAEILRVTPETVYQRIKSGDLKAAKPFGEYRIPQSEVDRLLAPSQEVAVTEEDVKDTGIVA